MSASVGSPDAAGRPFAPDSVIRFGPFEFRPWQRALLRHSQPVQLGSRALEILLVLIENAGRLVGKNDLIARVWPNVHIDEVALRVHIAALRKVLNDGRPTARDLLNIPGQGYQFVTPITLTSAAGAPPKEPVQPRQIRNVPAPLTRVIGRENDVERITALLQASRCITITGTGGIGKTTTALVVGRRLVPRFRDGVCFVDLAPLSDGAHAIDAIAAALGAAGNGSMSARKLAELLGEQNMLLIIDNCEHVAAEVAHIVETLVAATEEVSVLITTRASLRIPAERRYRLPPLKTPSQTKDLTAAEAMTFPAVELFVERAAVTLDRFVLDDENAPIVAAICSQLDGLALAIELAAMRTDSLGVAAIAAMLEQRFHLLGLSRRGVSARHSSLLATLDWSYGMLGPQQRVLLHRIAAFVGRFTFEDALAVARDGSFQTADVIECLADLVDSSILMVDLSSATAFYRLYETMREYAQRKIVEAGELADTRRRHAEYIATLFAHGDAEAEQREPADWRQAYCRYIDDVRAALDWSTRPEGEVELGISLSADAVTMWTHLSLFREMQQRLEWALERLGPHAVKGGAREMKLFAGLSTAVVNLYGATPEGTRACQAARDIARRIGSDSYQAKALLALWNGCFANGEVRMSLDLAEEFMSVAARLGHADVLVGHRMLGSSSFYLGDVVTARQHMETMVSGYGATTHGAHMARFSFGQLASGRGLLAFYLCFQGYFDQAMEATRQSVEEVLQSNHAMTACGVLGTTSIQNSIYTGHLDEARRYVEILYDQSRGPGLRRWENFALGYDGILCIRQGQLDEGLRKLTDSFAPEDDRSNTRYALIFCEHALALGLVGQPDRGLGEIATMRDRLAETGVRWYMPEVHRCRARLLDMSGEKSTEIESAFRQALSLGEAMGALNWRLRAARDFAEYLNGQGRRQEGLELLRSIHDLFVKGHTAPMLVATQEQLAGLVND